MKAKFLLIMLMFVSPLLHAARVDFQDLINTVQSALEKQARDLSHEEFEEDQANLITQIKQFLTEDNSVNYVDGDSDYSLLSLSALGFPKAIAFLVNDKNADINLQTDRGTAIVVASGVAFENTNQQCFEIVQFFLSQENIELTGTDAYGNTALHAACDSDFMPVVRLLKNAGANAATENSDGFVPEELLEENQNIVLEDPEDYDYSSSL